MPFFAHSAEPVGPVGSRFIAGIFTEVFLEPRLVLVYVLMGRSSEVGRLTGELALFGARGSVLIQKEALSYDVVATVSLAAALEAFPSSLEEFLHFRGFGRVGHRVGHLRRAAAAFARLCVGRVCGRIVVLHILLLLLLLLLLLQLLLLLCVARQSVSALLLLGLLLLVLALVVFLGPLTIWKEHS